MIVQNFDEIAISPKRKEALEVLSGAFDRLSPEDAVRRAAESIKDKISMHPRISVIGFGKASYQMFRGIREFILPNLRYAGIIVPQNTRIPESFPELEILEGTHPMVSEKSVKSSEHLLEKVGRLEGDDLVIVLISGGGSALFEVPEDLVTADGIAKITNCMMRANCDIYELNTVRTALSKVKGGKLAKILYPAKIISFIISDVVGNDLRIIASGPLVWRKKFILDIEGVLKKFSDNCDLKSIEDLMMFPPDDEVYFERVKNNIILANEDFVSFIEESLSRLNNDVVNLGTNIQGEVREVARTMSSIIREVAGIKQGPFWFVAGGETTVNVTGTGSGGRNQELCLHFMNEMRDDEEFLFMSAGTDGIDGQSDAMGGIVDSYTKKIAVNLDLDKLLENNDSYNALKKCSGTIMTGRTGNNVSDVIIGFYSGKS